VSTPTKETVTVTFGRSRTGGVLVPTNVPRPVSTPPLSTRHAAYSPRVTGDADGRRSDERYRECESCGRRVLAAAYREHLLKECPGE
jgi:hypothetical protein